MPLHLKIELTPEAQAVLAGINSFPERLGEALKKTMDEQNMLTVGHIVANRLSKRGPDTLGVRTGLLRRSLRTVPAILVTGSGMFHLESAIGTNVEYAGIHEFGGTTPPHEIKAKNAGALAFTIGGRIILRKSVKHPGSKFPARAPIRRGIEDRAGEYGQALSAAILSTWKGGQ